MLSNSKESFLSLLDDVGAYEKFVENLRNKQKKEGFAGILPDDAMVDFFLNAVTAPSLALVEAFNWSETPQGDRYWREINEEWVEECFHYDDELRDTPYDPDYEEEEDDDL